MALHQAKFDLASPEETGRFASALALLLAPGDTILLEGPVGAGKTHFARNLIQHILPEPEDVPSPTFTLVQSYETEVGPLWHADLYRLTSVYEVEELGLAEAFDTAICLVEWPDRLGDLAPDNALTLRFAQGATDLARHFTAEWTDAKWTPRITAGLCA